MDVKTSNASFVQPSLYQSLWSAANDEFSKWKR